MTQTGIKAQGRNNWTLKMMRNGQLSFLLMDLRGRTKSGVMSVEALAFPPRRLSPRASSPVLPQFALKAPRLAKQRRCKSHPRPKQYHPHRTKTTQRPQPDQKPLCSDSRPNSATRYMASSSVLHQQRQSILTILYPSRSLLPMQSPSMLSASWSTAKSKP